MLQNLLANVFMLAGEYTFYFAKGMAYLAAGIAVLTGASQGIGQSMVAAKACEAIGRQPEASGKITSTMIVGQAIAETTGLYALLTAILLIFATISA